MDALELFNTCKIQQLIENLSKYHKSMVWTCLRLGYINALRLNDCFESLRNRLFIQMVNEKSRFANLYILQY